MSEILEAMLQANKAIRKGFTDVGAKKLCHYTSPSGLLGIFSKNEPTLYFSQYDSLNDMKERKDIFECLHKFCDEWLKTQRISKTLHDDILSIPPSDFFGITRRINEKLVLDNGDIINEYIALSNEECYTYICSFSKNNDSLPMWRMYSKADHYEGFCIEFSSSAFPRNQNSQNGFYLHLRRVIYDERKKKELIESVLSPIIPLYDTASSTDREDLLSIVKRMITEFQFVFKNKAFSYEEEIRAVLHIPRLGIGCKNRISERQYRQSNGLIVPYVVYELPSSSVRSITIAPTIKEEIAINNLKDYLLSKNMRYVNTISSDIPIRNV